MDKGYNGEYGPPNDLLNNKEGLFKGLWDKHVGATQH